MKAIDLEEITNGDALARELERHPEGVILRRSGRQVAVVSAIAHGDVVHPGPEDAEAPPVFTGAALLEFIRKNGPIFSDETYEQLLWNRRFDRGLAEIGSAIGPMPKFFFTPERLNRILDIIGSIKGIDADEMRRIVEESRQLSAGERETPEQASDMSRP